MTSAEDVVAAARRDGSVDLNGLRLDLDPRAETLLVACSGLNPPGRAAYTYEHTDIQQTTSRLYVSDRTNGWYLAGLAGVTRSLPETLDLMAAIIARVAAPRTMALGTSMGGYVSLLLGARGAVDNAVAFAPQTTVEPGWRARNGDTRWNDELQGGYVTLGGAAAPDVLTALTQAAVPSRRLHVLFPTGDEVDVAHARRLEGLPGVFLYPVPTYNHVLSRFLKQQGVLHRVITDILDGLVPLDLVSGLRDDENDPDIAFRMGQALFDAGDHVAAEAAFRRALAGETRMNHYHNGLAQALWQQGRRDEAMAVVANAAAILPRDAYAQQGYGTFLVRAGRQNEAEAYFRAAIALDPRDERFFESLAQHLVKQNRVQAAAALRGEALARVRDPVAFERNMAAILASKARYPGQ